MVTKGGSEVMDEKQAKRLSENRCPVHGLFMSQVGLTPIVDGRQEFITACPRKDCGIEAITPGPDGPARLKD